MWFNANKSPKILKQWKSLISLCNNELLGSEIAQNHPNFRWRDRDVHNFLDWYLWSFVCFNFNFFRLQFDICIVSMTDLSGFRWELSGFQFGSVWCESEWRLHDCQLGVGGNGTKDERIFSRVRLFFSPNWIVIQRSRGKSVDCPSKLILISLPSLVWKEDMKMIAINSMKKWTKERRRFWRKAIFPAKTTQRWKILLNLESKCISLD